METGDVVRFLTGFWAGELAIIIRPLTGCADEPLVFIRLMGQPTPIVATAAELRLMTNRREDGLWTGPA